MRKKATSSRVEESNADLSIVVPTEHETGQTEVQKSQQVSTNSGLKPPDEVDKIELETLFAVFPNYLNSRLQVSTFFTTINLAALSLAFSLTKAGPVIFAGFLLWVFIFFNTMIRGATIASYFRLLQLQERFSRKDNLEYLQIYLPESLRDNEISKIVQLTHPAERVKALRQIRFRERSLAGFWWPFLGGLVQIGVGIGLWLFGEWPLF